MAFVQNVHSTSTSRRSNGQSFDGVTHQYNISDFQGYAGHFDKATVAQLQNHKDIDHIEPDQIWSLEALITQSQSEYGLSLISQKTMGRPGYFYDSSAGAGTWSYVVDSGINIEHREFQGRGNLGYNAVDKNARAWGDRVGHGTHIAGIMGSKTYGVAKKTQLIAVKVVDGRDGVFSQILDGYQWAVKDITSKGRTLKAVIHVSTYGPYTQAWERAVKAAFESKVTTVYPAGNENRDPTPRLGELSHYAIIVGATNARRYRAQFTNYGPAVTIFAPGVEIKSTWGHDGTRAVSGTAQAAAHVSGLISYFKGLETVLMPSARAVRGYIIAKSLPEAVAVPGGPKARFAYNGSGR
ncbi:alkaline protease [Myriangium duriaei CBS 260.36]|uniref:Alkaline protease n=1 Tax=Myriangium duriaei CBS 260.36 TaxID=1168546 RepID=A0A9P4IQA8_9PEZI|nr:alkaline protease [Myriangium duriaei CBS 260.36]